VNNDLAIFSSWRGRPNTVLSRRLPEITARDGLPIVPSVPVHPRAVPANLTRVETFPGAACLRRFPVVHALRQIRGSSGTFQSGTLQAWTPSILPWSRRTCHLTAFFNPSAAGLGSNEGLKAPAVTYCGIEKVAFKWLPLASWAMVPLPSLK
jgi:hypothetical protein